MCRDVNEKNNKLTNLSKRTKNGAKKAKQILLDINYSNQKLSLKA